MRLLRLGVWTLLACLLAVAGSSAYAAEQKQSVFKVTLTATLTKEWTFTQVEESETDCVRTTRGVGRWQAKLSARTPARMRAIAAANGRVRFSGAVVAALAGAATRSGSMTTTAGGPAPCERLSRSVRCGQERRTFRRVSTSVANPRRGILQLGRLRGADSIQSFRSTCLEEPSDIRAIRTDLPLATGPLDSRDVFDPNVPRWFVTGDTEQVTTLEGGVDGRVTERVRWTLNFSRLSS
ncbi:MAG: hypothetical protein ACRDNH_10765 [Gaiellaceae bacterium]